MIGVGTCVYVYKKNLNACHFKSFAGSSSDRLVEALSHIYRLLNNSEVLSTLDNPALSTTLSRTELTVYGS